MRSRRKKKVLNLPIEKAKPIQHMISKANQAAFDHVGKFLIHHQVYVDSKQLTLPAWNWAARYVAAEASNSFSYSTQQETVPSNISLQYER